MELLLSPMSLFVGYPYLALLPVLIFGAVYAMLYRGSATGARRFVLAAAIVWLLYAIYEWRMYLWSKTVIAPIRVDLFLVAPIVYLATLVGLVGSVLGFRRSTRNDNLPRA